MSFYEVVFRPRFRKQSGYRAVQQAPDAESALVFARARLLASGEVNSLRLADSFHEVVTDYGDEEPPEKVAEPVDTARSSTSYRVVW